MCMVLKTFKLSKIALVHLLYLILIVITVSNQADEKPADPTIVQTDENINDVTTGTDPISLNVNKGSTVNGEDSKLDEEDNPFGTMMLDVSPEQTTPIDLKPEEKELEAQNDQNIKGADPNPSDVDQGSTTGMIEQKKNPIKILNEWLNSRNLINQPNKIESNNIDSKENNIHVADNMVEDQKLDIEDNPFGTMMLDVSPEQTTPEDLKPEEKELEAENDQNTKDGITNSKKKKKKKKKNKNTNTNKNKKKKKKKKKSEIIPDTQDTPLPLEPINPKDSTPSSHENINLEPEEKELEAQNDQNIKGADPNPSDVDQGSTTGMIEQKKNPIKILNEWMNSRHLINQPNKIESNNIDSKENNIRVADNMVEDQKLDKEDNSFGTMMLDVSPEQTTPEDLKPEEEELEAENDQNTKDGITSSKIKNQKKSVIIPDTQGPPQDTQGSPQDTQGLPQDTQDPPQDTQDPPQDTQGPPQDTQGPPQDTQDTSHPLKPIHPNDLILSSLENVEIVKIKREVDPVSEAIRKEKKRSIFKEFAPSEGNARIYCTFLGNVLKMYNKVKKRFIGHFCHAIVFGAPIILKNHRVHLSENMRDQLHSIHEHKELSLLIVIMQFSNYKYWKHALYNKRGMKNLIIDIIHTAVHYKIDGIQFSNLHPTGDTDEVNIHMMNKLIRFIENLELAAKAKNHDLKIGITIEMHGLSIIKSFTSFKHLNSLVTWYSIKTISMVTCSSEYTTTGTSPLEGNMGYKMAINTLIEKINHNNEFDMTKLVVGIQLFPNKEHDSYPYTYEELCSSPKDTWHKWCAAKPTDYRAKGRFLRGTQIGGVQLYYMHSDDYRSTCGCYSFPLIRALLRGLIKVDTPETCDFETAHN